MGYRLGHEHRWCAIAGRISFHVADSHVIGLGVGCVIAYVLPCYLTEIRRLLADAPDVGPAAPVGFPSGGHTTEIKVAETRQLVAAGLAEGRQDRADQG